MNNIQYWTKRALQKEQRSKDRSESFLSVLKKEYASAQKNIKKDIEKWIERYAADNKISIAQVNKKLSPKELKEYSNNINKYLKLVTKDDPKIQKQLTNDYIKHNVTRLQALNNQIEIQLKALGQAQNERTFDYLKKTYKNSYYEMVYDLSSSGIKTDFKILNNRLIESVVNTNWVNENFSERIWKHNKQLLKEIRGILTSAVASKNINTDKMSRLLGKRMKVNFSNAKRLVRTETNFVLNQGTLESYKDAGLKKYQFIATLDKRTSAICRKLDNKIFLVKDMKAGVNYPPMHPNCRSTTIPYFDEDKINRNIRVARDHNDKGINIPADMDYTAWYNKYIKPYEFTIKEKNAVNKYISGESYIINEKLRNDSYITKKDKAFIESLDSALNKCEVYNGQVTRSLYFNDEQAFRNFISEHKAGKIVSYKGYTSTTIGKRYNDKSHVELSITSKTGKDISLYNFDEQEVLFKRGVKFKVSDIFFDKKNNVVKIIMEETDEV